MVTYRAGNIFEQADLFAIAHQANCFKQMGAGFVMELCKRYPGARRADDASLTVKTAEDLEKKLGTFTTANVNPDNDSKLKLIYNVYSQGHWRSGGCNTDYSAIRTAFTAIRGDLEEYAMYRQLMVKLGVPHFYGSGLGGGEWWRVDKIFNEVFNDGPVELVICKL